MSKKFSHCQCDQLTMKTKPGFIERILMFLLPHFDIIKTIKTTNGSSVTVLYLRRFYIWRSSWIGMNFGDVYLHKFYRSDDDPDPHDHPWNFYTIVLKGSYTDEAWQFTDIDGLGNGYRFRLESQDELVKAPTIKFRHRRHIHRALLTDGKPAWTLILAGKYHYDVDGNADWNFITQERAVPWREYLGLTKGEDHGG